MKKRILFITQRYPYPLISGDRLRAYNFLKMLSALYDVDLLVLENFKGRTTFPELSFLSKIIHIPVSPLSKVVGFVRGVFRGLPLQVALNTYAPVARYVDNYSSQYDLVYCHLIRTAEYARSITTKKVLDYCDSFSCLYAPHQRAKGFWGFFALFEYPRMKSYEQIAAAWFDRYVVSCRRDADWLVKECGVQGARLSVMPNGASEEALSVERVLSMSTTLIFCGNMNYYPNVDGIRHFARHVFPVILTHLPSAHLLIVGAHPSRLIRKLRGKNITVTGYVPNVSEYLRRARVAVVPLRIAAGIQNKVLEAMAVGLPVVTSSAGVGGLDVVSGKHAIITDIDNGMADEIIDLLADFDKEKRIGECARKHIQENYRWSYVKEHLTVLIGEILSSKKN